VNYFFFLRAGGDGPGGRRPSIGKGIGGGAAKVVMAVDIIDTTMERYKVAGTPKKKTDGFEGRRKYTVFPRCASMLQRSELR
jgi:hypothetical protein